MHIASKTRRPARTVREQTVSAEEAATAFQDPLSLTIFDDEELGLVDRFVLLGATDRDRLVVVVHLVDALGHYPIRILAARVATQRERRAYGDL